MNGFLVIEVDNRLDPAPKKNPAAPPFVGTFAVSLSEVHSLALSTENDVTRVVIFTSGASHTGSSYFTKAIPATIIIQLRP